MLHRISIRFACLVFCFPLFMTFGQTTIYLDPVADASVNSIFPDYHYGITDLIVSSSTSPLKVVTRSFIKFDISGAIAAYNIPENAVITNAELVFSINSESATVNSSTMVLRKVTGTWTETGLTYATMPAVTTVNQVISSTKTTPGGISAKRHFNVTQHVSEMLRGGANEGWCLGLNLETVNENATYYSRENTTNKPYLSISYCIPHTIASASITHASTSTSSDGSIVPVFANGCVGMPTYKWYKDGSTLVSQNASLTGQKYGWYGLEITGFLGEVSYYSFIIGVKCEVVDISYNPNFNYVDDIQYTTITTPLSFSQNGLSTTNKASYSATGSGGMTQTTNTAAMKFRLWIPSDLEVTQANLNLYGGTHTGTNNATTLYKNTTAFNEFPIYPSGSFSARPLTSAVGTVLIPDKAPGVGATHDIKHFWNEWKEDNLLNYGMTLKSNNTAATEQSQIYSSSDATKSPIIDFKFSNDCTEMFAHLEYQMDGYYYIMQKGEIRFVYNQEYDAANLVFNIYNSNDVLIKTQTNFPTVSTTSGVNYLTFSVKTDTYCIGEGFFYLEVINSKKEKMYMRFYNDYKGCTPP